MDIIKKLKRVISAVLMVSMIGAFTILVSAEKKTYTSTVNKFGQTWSINYSVQGRTYNRSGITLVEGISQTSLKNYNYPYLYADEIISGTDLVGIKTGKKYNGDIEKIKIENRDGKPLAESLASYPHGMIGEDIRVFASHNVWSKKGLVFREYTNCLVD